MVKWIDLGLVYITPSFTENIFQHFRDIISDIIRWR